MSIFHNDLINRTKYIITELSKKYKIYHHDNINRAHEFIINTREFDKYNIKEIDIAKRLIDYGIHAPTMSWPILKSLMVEVTETESEEEVNRFIKAMLSIYDEIKNKPELLHNAPHTQQDIINWKYNYSIEEACYPLGEPQIDKKFWPTVNRVNDLYGDKLFY